MSKLHRLLTECRVISVATSRFNNETWEENHKYRDANTNIACIYGVPQQLSDKIFMDSPVFVLEMNNSKNKIEGVGLIRNMVMCDKYYRVYEKGNYNRYVYSGKYRIDRKTMESTSPHIVKIIDHILFKEKTHMKRGSGITLVPEKLLKHPVCQGFVIVDELIKMFKDRYPQTPSPISETRLGN